jgi:hypothetical protein
MTDAVLTEEQLAQIAEIHNGVAADTREDFKTDPGALPADMKGERYPKRSKSVTIFPDGVAGEQYQAVEAGLSILKNAVAGAEEAGDEDALKQLQGNLDTAEAKAAEILSELKKSAYTFELRALPPIIMRGLRREVRSDLGITVKGVPEDREEEYEELFTIKFLAKQTVRFVDHAISDTPVSMTEEERVAKLQEIFDNAGDYEWLRLVNLANDLQFRSTISNSVVESADFS